MGQEVTYTLHDNGETVIARMGNWKIFELEAHIDENDADASYFKFTLTDPIDNEQDWDGPGLPEKVNIDFTLKDADGSTKTGQVMVKIHDDAPTAQDDMDMTLEGGMTLGNVITGDDPDDIDPSIVEHNQGDLQADEVGADYLHPAITQVMHNGETYALVGGEVTFTTAYNGSATIYSDGNYKYTAPDSLDHSEFHITTDNIPGFVTITALNEDGSDGTLSVVTNDPIPGPGFGVDGNGDDEIDIVDNTGANDPSETLIFSLAAGMMVHTAMVDLAKLFPNEGGVGNEQGRWEAYNDGVLVGGATFSAVDPSGERSLNIDIADGFDELRFTATNGSEDTDGGDSSDYTVQGIWFGRPMYIEDFKYTLEDGDGSHDDAVLSIKVKDDSPTIQVGNVFVDEDGLPDGVGDMAAGDAAATMASATGSIAIDFGADGPDGTSELVITLDAVDTADPALGPIALTKDGNPVTTSWNGATNTLTGSADGSTVFTLVVNDDGTYDFSLLQNLDHPSTDSDGNNDGNPQSGYEDDLVLSFTAKVTDADGSVDSDSFTVTIDDDMPIIGTPEDAVSAEADLINQTFGDLDINWGADNNDRRTGNFNQDDVSGTPGDRSVTFSDTATPGNNIVDSLGVPLSLTSGGQELVYSLNSDSTILTAQAGGQTVFSVELEDDGSGQYRFIHQGVLDHPDDAADSLDLNFMFKATDSDGDMVLATFKVTVVDDVPHVDVRTTGETLATLNLDETTDGPDRAAMGETSDNNSLDDQPSATTGIGSLTTVAGALAGLFDVSSMSAGADGEASSSIQFSLTLADNLGAPQASLLSNLSVTDPTDAYADDQIYLFLQSGEINGRVGNDAGGDIAFTLSLSADTDLANAALTVEQFLAIEHGDTSLHDEEAVFSSDVQIGVQLAKSITDNDGDSASDSESVNITSSIAFDDDGPKIINDMVMGSVDEADLPTGDASLAAMKLVGAKVAVFDNGSFVDTNGTISGNESDTIQASISSLGHTVSTFIDITEPGFATALAGQDVLVIPEQERGVIGPALSPGAIDTIREFVADGGSLVIAGRFGADSNFLNTVFGFSTSSSSVSSSSLTGDASGTQFSDDNSSIPSHSATQAITTSSLPIGSLNIYGDASSSTVAVMPFGQGQVTFVGWDWFNAAPLGIRDSGWLQVLDSAISKTSIATTEISATLDLSGRVDFGTDGNGGFALKDPTADGTLTPQVTGVIGAPPASVDLTSDGTPVLYTGYDVAPDGTTTLTATAGGDVVFTVAVTSAGGVTYTQFQQINQAGQDGNPLKIDIGYNSFDGDGDSVMDAFQIKVIGDDIVTITDLTAEADGGDVTVDEHGLPPRTGEPAGSEEVADGDPNDDSNMDEMATGTFTIDAPDGIGSITLGSGTVQMTFTGLQLANSGTSPLTVTTPLGNTLEIIGFNSGTGEVTYKYTLVDNENHGPGDNGEDNIFDNIPITVQDTDDDTASGILAVKIVDDLPQAVLSVLDGAMLIHDETPGPQSGNMENDVSDPTALAAATALFASISSPGDDPDVPPATGPIGYASQAGSSLFNTSGTVLGADGTGSTGVFSMRIDATGPVFNSGLKTTALQDIDLYLETYANGTFVVGRHALTAGGATDSNSPAAFAIHIDPSSGDLSMVQYVSLQHPLGSDPNDPISFAFGKLSAVWTVTDSDGDKSEASVDLGDSAPELATIKFLDDGPTFNNVDELKFVDEDGLPNGAGDSVSPGDNTNTNSATVSGNLGINFGSDGPGSTITDVVVSIASHDYEDPNIPGTPPLTSDGLAVRTSWDDTSNTLTGYIDDGTANMVFDSGSDTEVFRLVINADGTYDFTLMHRLDHPSNINDANNNQQPNNAYEDNIVITFEAIITDGDGDTASQLFSIDIDDDIPVVGAMEMQVLDEAALPTAFDFSSVLEQKVLEEPTTSARNSDQFGWSVAISDNKAVIGARLDDGPGGTDQGAVFVFEQNVSGTWQQVQKLVADDAGTSDYFGWSVSIENDEIAVGAPLYDVSGGTNQGAVYIFRSNSSGIWSQTQRIEASDAAGSDRFGWDVSLSGDWLLVGSPLADSPAANSGAAYAFRRDSSGNWIEQQKLSPGDLQSSDDFGWSVSISGNYAVVGTPFDDDTAGTNQGSAYVFELDGANVWQQVAKLTPSNADAHDQFGWSVSISGGIAVVTSRLDTDTAYREGSAYVFERDGSGNWHETFKVSNPNPGSNDFFGMSVDISGEVMIVGAESDDSSGVTNAGAAYIYERESDGSWTLQSELFASDGQSFDLFGGEYRGVGISQGTALVGAWLDDDNGTDSGSAYFYTADGTSSAPLVATGTLDFSYGADEQGMVVMLTNVAGLTDQSLTSGGTDLEYAVTGNATDGYVLTAHTGNTSDPVFTLELDTDGNYTFTLFKQIDHPGAGDDVLPIDLSSMVAIIDADGDTVFLPTGHFSMKITDDVPLAVNDTDAISSLDDTVVQGNVIDGTSENGTGQADDFGNDGPDSSGGVVGVDAGATGVAAMTGVGATITGLYGDLVMTASGDYTYTLTANSIPPGAMDSFTYTIADADGDTSFATLMIDVPQINGLVVGENANDSGVVTDLPIHVIDTVNPGAGGDINGGVGNDVLIGDVGGANQLGVISNYVLIMDTSGSMNTSNRIGELKTAVTTLLNSLANSGAKDVRVHMVEFNFNANPVTFGNGNGTYDIVSNGIVNATVLALAIDAVNNLNASGLTNYEAGFQSAINLINSNGLLAPTAGEVLENQAFFFSDGQPNRALGDSGNVISTNPTNSVDHVLAIDDSSNELSTLNTLLADDTPGGEIDSIGIELQNNQSALNLLDRIDTQDGDSTNVANASDLNQVLQDLSPLNNIASVGADVINGGDGEDVILGDAPFTDDLASDEGLSTLDGAGWEVIQELMSGNGDGSSGDPAGDNASAGNAWTNEDVIAYITANAASLARESLSSDGNPRAGGNDIINGGGGNDLIFGMEGDDTIMGGSGNDTQYGGSGADTFKIDELNVNDLIADYESGDFIDLTVLFDLPSSGGTPDTANVGDYVNYDPGSGILSVDASGSNSFGGKEAVTVDTSGGSAPASVTIIVDDGAGTNASIVV